MSIRLGARSMAAVWHPCTQMAWHRDAPPLAIVRGEGPWLIDDAGRRYFDACSSWWVNLFGHSDRRLRDAVHAQLDCLPHVMLAGCTHEPAVRLAERLSARTGHVLGHAFFASDGASAVEIALKMSAHHWRNRGQPQRHHFLCLQNGYHGETLGALGVTDVAVFRAAYGPMVLAGTAVTAPDSRLGPEQTVRALADLRAALEAKAGTVAGVVLEPLVQGAAGMVMHDAAYLRGVRALCTAYDVHLIADEIAMGCGRTGRFFASEWAGIWPDLITLSKGITGGLLPLSLVLCRQELYESFLDDDIARGFLHSHSYTGNALACAAANAVLDRFDDGTLFAELATQAQELGRAFAPLAQHPAVQHLRQTGTIVAFDVDPSAAGARFALRFHRAAQQHELLIRPIGNTVYVMPPYLIDAARADFLAQAVAHTLQAVLSGAPATLLPTGGDIPC